jgi:tRNA pseudouridine38/39 synthase
MAAVLFMVGRGEEEPGIIAKLLDVTATPCKPSYVIASDEPLLLYGCVYRDLEFRRSAANHEYVREGLEAVMGR